jgi:YHS domain-containing protein
VFVHGHGFWTTLENVVVGPFVAVISFVCSIGNVPLAATLWHGGISFGGVVAFVFADLITLPLLLIYRKYYGTAMTLRLVAWFWAVMSVAGLAVEGIFSAFGLVPHTQNRPVVATAFHWNYTTYLNIVFLLVAGYLFWLYRHRSRLGGGAGYATDPVCGMQVRTDSAPAQRTHGGVHYWFCSDRCADRFVPPSVGPPSRP